MRFLIVMLASMCMAAQVESTDLSQHFVFFEQAAGRADTDPAYWVRGLERQPRLTGNAIVLDSGTNVGSIGLRFSDGAPVRREGAAAGFVLNEFRGPAEGWRRGIGIWQSVLYQAVRPGVDLDFSLAGGLQMTATIAPGIASTAHYFEPDADAQIAIRDGTAVITQGAASIQLGSPSAWQMRGGQHVEVAAQFGPVSAGRIGVQPASYDATLPLYVSVRFAVARAANVPLSQSVASPAGGFYLAGAAASPERCGMAGGGRVIYCADAWVARFLASGQPAFLTRLSGEYQDAPNALTIAPNGDVLVAGYTDSAAFPATANALQRTNAGPIGARSGISLPIGDGFVARLDGTNGNLLYSTFYGLPSAGEAVTSLAVSDQVLITVNGVSLALLDEALSRTLATKNLDTTYVSQPSLSPNGEATYWDVQAGALIRLRPGLGERRFTFEIGYKGQSMIQSALDLPGGNILLVWDQGVPNEPEHVTYLSEIAASGEREIWRTEVAPKGTGAFSISRDSSGAITLLLSTTMANVPTTDDAIVRGACVGNAASSVMVQRYSAIGDLLYSSYLPSEVRTVSAPVFAGPQAFAAVDYSTLKLYRVDLNAPHQPALACVTGGASRLIAAAIAPGQIITLLGAGLSGPGTEVLVNQVRAPLLYESSGQINAVVPYEGVAPGGSATIEVRRASAAPLSWTASVRSAAVELFTLDASGTGQAVALNRDGTLNSRENPAPAGSVVAFWGTGIGDTTPGSVTGAIAPVAGPGALAQPRQAVTAQIGFTACEVLYAGAAPGLINGAAQFNLRVPASTPPGRWPVGVKIGDSVTPTNVTIWTKGAN